MTLHTKYRPSTFEEVIGQEKVVGSLERALKKDTSRTFLLHGPSGCGKTTLARIASKVIGCEVLTEIDAATYTGIEDMRSVTSSLDFKPLYGENKAIIIDEAHALSAQAWKALLKSLEEPPSWVYWFLCTTELGKVPATIKTRCTTLALKLVPVDDLKSLLTTINKAEKLKAQPDVIAVCAENAQGSPRQAIVNLETCLSAENSKEAADLLQTAGESPAAADLARALLRGESWKAVCGLLRGLRDVNPETVRHVIRAYMTNVILGAKDSKTRDTAFAILDVFSKPFPSGDGVSPVVLACGRLLLT